MSGPDNGPGGGGEKGAKAPGWRRHLQEEIAARFSLLTRYCDRVIQWLPASEDRGALLARLDAPVREVVRDGEPFPDLAARPGERVAVLLNGTLNHHHDIQGLLGGLKGSLVRSSRVLVVLYNPYLGWLFRLAGRLGIRSGEAPTTFVTRNDLAHIADLAGYAIVRTGLTGYCPWRLLGLGTVVNRLLPLVPLVRWSALAYLVVLRPVVPEGERRPSLSCVIPARNERGNIENAVQRLPDLGCDLEVLFVEGHSTDGTWDEILRVQHEHGDRLTIRALRQEGVGKGDAVRLGFDAAEGELLAILDADLTMPPELLGQFYEAYRQGRGDFVNGSRLVYPMEGEAMRPLNRVGNVFFAKALSWVLDARIGDSLCGTKLFSRADYARMRAWRRDFGDLDPFGDFELLFPAAVMGLGIADVPIRYRSRDYGRTNIHRFRHGLILLRMTAAGFWRIKLGVGARSRPSGAAGA